MIPDLNADGLAAATILSQTLQLWSKPRELIHAHLVPPNVSMYSPEESERLARLCDELDVSHIILLDRGERTSVQLPRKTLVLDCEHGWH